jgi:hypothetical protein
LSHEALNINCAAHRIHDTTELDQQSIAHRFDDTPAMFADFRVNEGAPQLLQPDERPLFIDANQPAVASDIGRQDCGKLSLRALQDSMLQKLRCNPTTTVWIKRTA